MSNVIPFQFESQSIRVQMGDEGQPWFNANDVCAALGLGNSRQALESHVDSEDIQKLGTLTPGGRQLQNHINESGLYALLLTCAVGGSDRRRAIRKAFFSQISDTKAILKALNDFEIPDDLPDMYVYAIRNTVTGNFKLGISRNPAERLKQLQTGNDCKLELIAYRKAENRFKDERQIHTKNATTRISGEWFSSECNGNISLAA